MDSKAFLQFPMHSLGTPLNLQQASSNNLLAFAMNKNLKNAKFSQTMSTVILSIT